MSRFLLTTFGSLGDLHPYIAIGRALLARGHAVTLLTHEPYRERVTRAGLTFLPLAPDLDALPDPADIMRRAMDESGGSHYILRTLVVPYLAEQMRATREAAAEHDVLVSHPVTLMTPHVAEAMGKPWASASLQPATLFSRVDPPFFPGPAAAPLSHLMRIGPGVAEWIYRLMMRFSRPWFAECDRLRAQLGLPRTSRHPLFESAFSPHLHLALFSPVFAPPRSDWPVHTLATGFPLHDRDERGGGAPPQLATWLDAGSPPLVFTLGSSAVFDPGEFHDESLRAARALGRRALILVGADPRTGEPLARPDAPWLADAPDAAQVALTYAPHSELMPRAAVVVHQGGIGTLGAALRSGRPMLVAPFSHDQPDNAARAVRLGVARTLARRDYRTPRLTRMLEAMLADPALSARAESVGRQVAAENGAQTAAEALVTLARAAERT